MNRVSARALVVRCRDWYRVLRSIFDFSFAIGLRYMRHFSFALSLSLFHFPFLWLHLKFFFLSSFFRPSLSVTHSTAFCFSLSHTLAICIIKFDAKPFIYRRNAEDFFHIFVFVFVLFSHQFFSVFIYFYLVNLQHNGLFWVITFFSTICHSISFFRNICKYDSLHFCALPSTQKLSPNGFFHLLCIFCVFFWSILRAKSCNFEYKAKYQYSRYPIVNARYS